MREFKLKPCIGNPCPYWRYDPEKGVKVCQDDDVCGNEKVPATCEEDGAYLFAQSKTGEFRCSDHMVLDKEFMTTVVKTEWRVRK
jgi:hypothetical protein